MMATEHAKTASQSVQI